MFRIFRILPAFLAVLLAVIPLTAAAEQTAYYTEMPEYLRMTQETVINSIRKNISTRITYPKTANEAVNREMAALIDAMFEKGRSTLSHERTDATSCFDVGAVVSRTGTSYMSFLTIAETSRDYMQHYVDFDARVYDIKTGQRIRLTDIFPEGSEAWSILSAEVRAQLSAAFPALEADEEMLAALADKEQLETAPFTMGAARLTLTYRADALYPGKNTLLHVNIDYQKLRQHMTPSAFAQTDNSRFRMAALTYDDGPVRDTTRRVMDELRRHGAGATFFVIGKRIARHTDLLARQQDSNYSIQSHTYSHRYPGKIRSSEIMGEKEQFHAALTDAIGVAPVMMRSPGGMDDFYVKNAVGYPIIHWSLASGDSGNGKAKTVAPRVLRQIGHGDIVLMHDLNAESPRYTELIVSSLAEQGYLLVTVEELFSAMGVQLEDNRVYFSPERIDE